MRSILAFLRRNLLGQIIASFLFLFFAFGIVKAVTTISANISTDGSLTVSSTTASSTIAYSLVVDTSTLVVNANENVVGIGTASPTSTFGVLGAARINGTLLTTGNFTVSGATATFFPSGNAANIFQVQNAAQSNVFAISTDGTVASSTVASSLIVDTPTLVVNANENRVGIGTVSPTTTLGILGAARINGALTVTDTGTFDGALTVNTPSASSTIAYSLVVDTSTLVVNANENRVGVGIATPSQLFSVGSSNAFTISSVGNATTTGNLTLNSANPFIQWAPTAAGDKLRFQTGTTTIASLDIGGSWVTKGPQTANGSPDVAEYILTRALTSKELGTANSAQARRLPEFGDVVAIDKAHAATAVLATKAYDKTYLGVIADGSSSFTSMAGLGDEPNARPLALVGRVRAKVTSENGMVRIGDFLTGSPTRPGYAMKATKPGYVIGKALENVNTEGEGMVLMFISNTYAVGE